MHGTVNVKKRLYICHFVNQKSHVTKVTWHSLYNMLPLVSSDFLTPCIQVGIHTT
jgi:hypothetical protein